MTLPAEPRCSPQAGRRPRPHGDDEHAGGDDGDGLMRASAMSADLPPFTCPLPGPGKSSSVGPRRATVSTAVRCACPIRYSTARGHQAGSGPGLSQCGFSGPEWAAGHGADHGTPSPKPSPFSSGRPFVPMRGHVAGSSACSDRLVVNGPANSSGTFWRRRATVPRRLMANASTARPRAGVDGFSGVISSSAGERGRRISPPGHPCLWNRTASTVHPGYGGGERVRRIPVPVGGSGPHLSPLLLCPGGAGAEVRLHGHAGRSVRLRRLWLRFTGRCRSCGS